MIELNATLSKNQEKHESELKKEKLYQEQMVKEFESYNKEVGNKLKQLLTQKEKLEEELAEAKEETEKIRKEMFVKYQDIILNLKN